VSAAPAFTPTLLPCPCGSGLLARHRARQGGRGLVCATCWRQHRAPRPAPLPALDGTTSEALVVTASQRLSSALCTGQAGAWHLAYALVFGEELPPELEEVAPEAFAQRLLAHAYRHASAPNPTAALIAACRAAGLLEEP
jgi:hypothetical protein